MAIRTGTNGNIKELIDGLDKVSHEDMCLSELKLTAVHKGKSQYGKFVLLIFGNDKSYGYAPTSSIDYFDEYEDEDNEILAKGKHWLHTEKKKSKDGKDYFVSYVEYHD
ncbi:MAG: hypothetical protein KBT36_14860 [Kurthia sp.]|nr:hypothetical protein [Candidatus Kurthia equi]